MYPYFRVFSLLIPSYGVMLALGLLVAGALAMLRVYRHGGLVWQNGLVFATCAFSGAMAGALLLYLIVTYTPAQLWELIRSGRIWKGEGTGLVFYGGLIGAFPGVLLAKVLTRDKLLPYVPSMLPCVPLGHAFGRVGCLLAGCCYGIPSDSVFAVTYHHPLTGAPTDVPLFPVQGLESLVLLTIFLILVLYTRKEREPLHVAALYLTLYAVCRFCMEFLRYDAIRGKVGVLSTSQFISVVLFLVGVLFRILPGIIARRKKFV